MHPEAYLHYILPRLRGDPEVVAFGTDTAFFIAWVYWVSLFVGNCAIAVAAVTGSLAYALLVRLERRVAFWHPSVRG